MRYRFLFLFFQKNRRTRSLSRRQSFPVDDGTGSLMRRHDQHHMIINTDEIKNIYVAKQFCDMRKQIDGLALIVISQFNMNVLDHSLFIFTNASRNRIKMLYYEANSFWLFTRRLENGKFKFKRHEESDSWKLNLEQKIQS